MSCSRILPVVFLLGSLVVSTPLLSQAIVAHRGASADAPENTLAAFELAWLRGADAVEGDFYLSRDGHLVCIHDRSTKRTAGVDLPVAETPLRRLRELDVGAWKGARYRGERIPTIDEVLAAIPRGKRIFIEVKCGPEAVPALRRAIDGSGLLPWQTVIISFDASVVARSRESMPGIAAHWITGFRQDKETGAWTPSHDEILSTLERVKASGLDAQAQPEMLDARLVRRLRSRGLEVHCWTVNAPALAAHVQRLGVDSITTDRPGLLRSTLLTRSLAGHLRLWMPLDGSLDDRASEGKSGTFVRADPPARPYVPGVFGQALDLGATGAAVAMSTPLPESGTLCLWYRPRGWYDHQTIVDTPGSADHWEMWIYGDARLRFRGESGAAVVTHALHPGADDGAWRHVAVTWDGARVRLWVDGILSDEAERGPDIPDDPAERSALHLGGAHPGNTPGRGSWDDVALFDTVLEEREIRAARAVGIGALLPLSPRPPTRRGGDAPRGGGS